MNIEKLRSMTEIELRDTLTKLRKEWVIVSMQIKLRREEDTKKAKRLRKDIARILTVLRSQKETFTDNV